MIRNPNVPSASGLTYTSTTGTNTTTIVLLPTVTGGPPPQIAVGQTPTGQGLAGGAATNPAVVSAYNAATNRVTITSGTNTLTATTGTTAGAVGPIVVAGDQRSVVTVGQLVTGSDLTGTVTVTSVTYSSPNSTINITGNTGAGPSSGTVYSFASNPSSGQPYQFQGPLMWVGNQCPIVYGLTIDGSLHTGSASCGFEIGDIYYANLYSLVARNYTGASGYMGGHTPYTANVGASTIGQTVPGITTIHVSTINNAPTQGIVYFPVAGSTSGTGLAVYYYTGTGTGQLGAGGSITHLLTTGGPFVGTIQAAAGQVILNTAVGDAGFWFNNAVRWTERLNAWHCHAENCQNGFIIDTNGTGTNSHEFSQFDLDAHCWPNQNGLILQNGVAVNTRIRFVGLFYAGLANNGTCMSVGADGTSCYLGGTASPSAADTIETKFETGSGGGSVAHYDLAIGPNASVMGVGSLWGTGSVLQTGYATNALVAIGGYTNLPAVARHGSSFTTLGNSAFQAAGTNTSGTAAKTNPTLGAAAQLANTSQDAMIYIEVTTAGTLTVAIGPTSGVADTIVNGVATAIGSLISLRLPAGWFIAVTTSDTAVWTATAVTC